ncbi:MAG TPA: antibiotic biosynthesis monooxygenase, partial [Candidatus Dormibacteraeota bacterium]|nr:antibiotic biosynthesis monooxygenase [Candidatus Dormibacteraeota bacterium]
MTLSTAVTIFHPVPDSQGFDTWLSELQASAQAAEGAVSTSVSVHDEPHLEWGLAVTFETEDLLHQWLDSAGRMAVLKDGQSQGYWHATTDLILAEGSA